jgi:hypothetical protein
MLTTELSADTRTVADLLALVPVGEVITLGAISEAIGRDVTTCRHVLNAARRVALREAGAAFLTERGIGLRRMSAERVTETVGSAARSHIRRTAGRARKVMVAATQGINDLPPAAQRKLAAEISVLGLMEHLARDKTMQPAPDSPTKPTPVAITAQALLSHLTKKEPSE